MKKIIYPTIAILILTLSAFTMSKNYSSWKVQGEQYTVKFTSDKVEGVFKGLQADIQFDVNNPGASKITASIDANTVNTGNGMRNKHAKQGLGADQNPTIRFESTSVYKSGNAYEASGKLSINGVTKDIKLPFTFTSSGNGGTFEGKFPIVTADYNINKSGTPERVEVQLTVPVTL